MRFEIEHKFLVRNLSWRGQETKTSDIVQGYFASSPEYSQRVRLIDGKALLTIKGRSQGISRAEFEYEIPFEDGQELLKEFCGDRIIEKRRYFVPTANGRVWEIDEYFGKCQGLYTAEIELESADEEFERPDWLGADVSEDSRFTNHSLAVRGLQAEK